MPSLASMAAFSCRAMDSTTFFSSVPDGPRAPCSRAAVARVDHDRSNARGLGQERRRFDRGRRRHDAWCRRCGRLRGRGRRRRGEDVDGEPQLVALALLGGAVTGKRRAERELDGRRRNDPRGRSRPATSPCPARSASRASAANRISSLPFSLTTVCCTAGETTRTMRVPLATGSARAVTAGTLERAHDDQRGTAAYVDAGSGPGRQGALDELDRHQPRRSLPHRRSRQADDAALDRRESLRQRHHDGPACHA